MSAPLFALLVALRLILGPENTECISWTEQGLCDAYVTAEGACMGGPDSECADDYDDMDLDDEVDHDCNTW